MVQTRRQKFHRTLLGERYLATTMEGIRFVHKWYTAEHIPPRLARLNQLLLKLIRMRGIMAIKHTKRYNVKVIDQARSTGYLTILRKPRDLPNDLQGKIVEIIGKAPGEIYA